MTDAEIIKALEYKTHKAEYSWVDNSYCDVEVSLVLNALDLINRQQAEIERLRNILLRFMDEVAKWENEKGIDVSELPLIPICDEGRDIIDHYRAKAIKEFVERLKEKAEHGWIISGVEDYAISLDNIDNLVKEMVGESYV